MVRKKPIHYEYLVLTPTEEKVVSFLKAKSPGGSISQISQSVALARTSIYMAVKSLLKKKLVQKNGFNYKLTSEKLSAHEYRDPKKQIDNLLEGLLGLRKKEVIYSIESDEEIEHLMNTADGLPKWQKIAVDKGIVFKGIGSMNALEFFQKNMNEVLEKAIKKRSGSARFVAETLSGPCTIISFRNSTIFFSRKNNFFYRIDNADLARFIQNIINSLYLNLQYKPLFIED